MEPFREGRVVRGVVVEEHDVGDEGGPRVEPLEEVVREDLVLGQHAFEHRPEGVHVEEPFAGEDPLAEEVLVDVADGGRVRVDAGEPGEDAGEARPVPGLGPDPDAGLEDAVAVLDAGALRVVARAVEGVGRRADEGRRALRRQLRVGVEREEVAEGIAGGDRAEVPLDGDVRGVGLRLAEEADELFEFAALPLPAHPRALDLVPAALAVEEEELIAEGVAVAAVERGDGLAAGGEGGGVAVRVLGGRVGEVGEEGEAEVGVGVGEGVDLEPLRLPLRALRRADERGDHDERPRRVGEAVLEGELREDVRRHHAREQPVREGDREVEDGEERDGDGEDDQAQVRRRHHVEQQDEDGVEHGGPARDEAEVRDVGVRARPSPESLSERRAVPQLGLQRGRTRPVEPVADVADGLDRRSTFLRRPVFFGRSAFLRLLAFLVASAAKRSARSATPSSVASACRERSSTRWR